MNVQTESYARIHGKWLLLARLAWVIMFTVLTVMYVLGFLAARDALSTVCKEELCTFRQQIRHTDVGEQVVSWSGPPIGYADRLRPDQVEALEGFGLTLDQYGWLGALQIGLPVLVYLLIAAGLFWWRSDDWMVLFASVMVATIPVGNGPLPFLLVVQRPAWEWVFDLASVIALSCFLIFPLIFPNGRFVPRWTRWIGLYEVAGAAIIILFQNSILERSGAGKFILVHLLISFGAGIYAQLHRYFRVASPLERQQLKWVIVGLAGFVGIAVAVLLPLDALLTSRAAGMDSVRALLLSVIPDTVFQLILLFIPVSIAISVLRYRLWDIDIFINRALVYGALTAGVGGLYVLIVGWSSIGLQTQNNLAGRVFAILVIVFLFRPLHQRLQRIADRFVPVPQTASRVEQHKHQVAIPESQGTADTTLRGRWLLIARLTWAAVFLTLTIMYAFGFLAVRETLSTVCDEELCKLKEQIQHTDAGDRIMSYWGPPLGYADRLRPEQIKALDTLGLTLDQYGWLGALQMGIPALVFLLIAAGLFWRKSDNWMVLFVSVLIAITPLWDMPLPFTLAVRRPAWEWVVALAFFTSQSFDQIWPLIFPTGRFVPRWTRWVLLFVFVDAAFWSFYRPLAEHLRANEYMVLTVLIFASIDVYALVYRYFRVASPLERQQLKWVLVGQAGFLFIAVLVLPPLNALLTSRAGSMDPARVLILSAIIGTLYHAITLFRPVSIVISVLRYRLWDVDIIISRTLVYGTLSVGIVITYILLVALLGTLFNTHVGLAAAILTAALIVPFFQPLRRRLQSVADGFMPVAQIVTDEAITNPLPQVEKERIITQSERLPQTTLHRSRLIILRMIWGIMALFVLSLVAVGVPNRYMQLTTISPDANTLVGQLQPEEAHTFEQNGLPVPVFAAYITSLNTFIGVVFALMGLIVAWLRPKDREALLVSIVLISSAMIVATTGTFQSQWHPVITIVHVIFAASIVPVFYLFPDGHFVPRWTRWLTVIWLVYTVTWLIFPSVSPPFSFGRGLTGIELPRILWFLLWVSLGLASQIYRYIKVSSAIQRQQIKWVVFGYGLGLIGLATGIGLLTLSRLIPLSSPIIAVRLVGITILLLGLLLIPLSIGISILRYHLFDVDIIINRTLVYGTLSAGIVVTYILLVGLLSTMFNTNVTLAALAVTAALIIPFFQPLRARLQSTVNRVTFGRLDLPNLQHEIEESQPEPEMLLRPRWLDVIHSAWFVCAILAGIVLVGAVPIYYSQYPQPIFHYPQPIPSNAYNFGSFNILLQILVGMGDLASSFISFALAILLFWRKPNDRMALFVSFFFLIAAVTGNYVLDYFLTAYVGASSTRDLYAALTFPLWILLFCIFPDGRFVPRWTRWLVLLSILASFSYFAFSNWFFILQLTAGPQFLLVTYAQVYRFRHVSSDAERQQTKWAVFGLLLTMVLSLIASLIYKKPSGPLVNLIPLFLAIAILRSRLWDIDLIINRALVYGALTAGIVALYILLVGALSLLSQTTGNLIISLLATGLIAFLFQPLRERLQRGVNRLVYGERDDPYVALSRLGRRLEASLAPEAVLPTVVTTVRDVLKLPYVAIYLKHEDGNKIAAESASPSLRSENGRIRVPGMEREGLCVPLVHQGETLGYIVLGPRAPNEAFSSTDLRLLDDLAPQVGVAVHAVRLTADLQRSRERLVLAREEERRRLRRDLHDDLGPTLASFGLAASTVADLIPQNPMAATKLVKELESQMRATVGNIRRLVYDLRPPTLDELGLLPAVRERATRFSNAPNGFHVTVDAPAELPTLPAAVEVAAYRIVQEALENVSKHSQARHCVIRLMNHNGLKIEITDDGIGLPPNITPGVGLRSMRERAEELGGSCVIERCVDGGTRILAHLPIGEFDGTFAYPDRG